MNFANYILAGVTGGVAGLLFVFLTAPPGSKRMVHYLTFMFCGVVAGPLIVLIGFLCGLLPLDTPISFLIEHQEYVITAIAGGLFGAFLRWVNGLNRPQSAAPNIPNRVYITAGMVAGITCVLLVKRFQVSAPSWDWVTVFALGALVGIGELASRYRDDPVKALFCIPAVVYVLLNAGAAALALALGRSFWWTETPQSTVDWNQVLTAGLGAMVLLRSSVFRVKVGDQDVAIGPSSFLQSVIDAADRAVDRIRAQERAWTVSNLMERVDPVKVVNLLPLYLPALMQNMADEDKKKFVTEATGIQTLPAEVQAFRLGLLVMNFTGAGVLRAAITSLADRVILENRAIDSAQKTESVAGRAVAATRQVSAAVSAIAAKIVSPDSSQAVQQAAAEAATHAAEAQSAAGETLEVAQETTRRTEAVHDATTKTLSDRPGLFPADDKSNPQFSSSATNLVSPTEPQLAVSNETARAVSANVDEPHRTDHPNESKLEDVQMGNREEWQPLSGLASDSRRGYETDREQRCNGHDAPKDLHGAETMPPEKLDPQDHQPSADHDVERSNGLLPAGSGPVRPVQADRGQ